MSNPTGKGGFQERMHQINRKGRPKSFDALRKEAIKISGEIIAARDDAGNIILGADGKPIVEASRAHAILLGWASSKDWQAQRAFVEYGFGKVPAKDQTTNINIDLDALTDEQLQRIANGDDPARVVADSRRGGAQASAEDASEADGRNPG
jgi:hypothetical protein